MSDPAASLHTRSLFVDLEGRCGHQRLHLRRWCGELGRKTGQTKWPEISEILETVMLEEKGIHCNVDFYSATVQHALGIPGHYFTAIFAASRTAGWLAHWREQLADNRIFRPTQVYTGEPRRKYVAIDKR